MSQVLIPRSQARLMTFMLSSSGRVQDEPSQAGEPKAIQPRIMREVLTPDVPRRAYCILGVVVVVGEGADMAGCVSYREFVR